MPKTKRKFWTIVLITNLVAAIIWQVVGHAAMLEAASQGGGSQHDVMTNTSSINSPVLVGPLLMPDVPDCAAHSISADVPSPDGRVIGRLSSVPLGLAQSVAATFPPCDVPKVTPVSQVAPSEQISFRILSQVQYSGSEGTLTVVTAVPSSAAVARGLDLGSPAGKLHDGTPLWSMQFTSNGTDFPVNHIEWFENGRIVELASNMPLASLEALAPNITVK